MPKDTDAASAFIGPHAVLDLLPLLEQTGGRPFRDQILSAAGIFDIPSEHSLMAEEPAARVHQALRRIEPEMAPALTWAAGGKTAHYVLKHRIPKAVQKILKVLPASLAAPMLTFGATKYAWAFVGSGALTVPAPMVFEVADNPIVRGEQSDQPLCHWHSAVFETLFATLVDPNLRCRETACCAMGDAACRFELTLA